jgi:NAD(P)H dehydrogenase (quinone)
MTKVLVLYYSSYGHMEAMAWAAAEGAESAGAEVAVKRVPEQVPEEVAKSSHFKLDQKAEIATPGELADYDAIIFGISTRFGMINSQMKSFIDQTGALWMAQALNGKAATVISSASTQHGGLELALVTTQAMLQHHGMIIVPLGYEYNGQMGDDVLRGGSPYGMTTISGPTGQRMPSEQELEGARFQGRRLAEVAAKLIA